MTFSNDMTLLFEWILFEAVSALYRRIGQLLFKIIKVLTQSDSDRKDTESI